eukprot:scaffold6556_cov106-Isochrysis_galbana.AAC.3
MGPTMPPAPEPRLALGAHLTSPATRHTDTRVRHNRHTRACTCVASSRWSYGPKADAESGA